MSDRRHPRYTISVAAELTGMHPQTLRMYDARGLVRPQRTPGGTRRYSEADLDLLRRVAHLTGEQGLSLAGAEHVLGLERQIADLRLLVSSLRAQLLQAAVDQRDALEDVHRTYRRDLVRYIPPIHPIRRVEPWTFRS